MSDDDKLQSTDDAEPRIEVETDAGGFPTDKVLRRYAVGMVNRARISSNCLLEDLILAALRPRRQRGGHGRHVAIPPAEQRRIDAGRDAARAVLEALLKSGRIVEIVNNDPRPPSYCYVPPPERLEPNTPEARRENYLAAARNIGRRVGKTDAARERVTDLYLKIRNIYGLKRVDFRDGRAVVVPSAISVGAGGPVITEALVIAALPKGLETFEAKEDAIVTDFGQGNEPMISLDPEKCTPWHRGFVSASDLTVSPFSKDRQTGTYDIARFAKGVLECLKGQREGVSLYVGEDMDKTAWLSFLASTRRASSLHKYIRTTIFSILDPEVRAAVLRHPNATYEFYNWFCNTDDVRRTRRLQASAAYPYLTSILRDFEDAIDRGEPLAPLLAHRFSATPYAIKHLRHLKWQSVGSPHAIPVNGHEFMDMLELLSRTVPEDLPVGRKAWGKAVSVSNTLTELFGRDLPPGLLHATRRLDSTARLVVSGFSDAIRDLTGILLKATNLNWDDYAIRHEIDFDILSDASGGNCRRSRNLHQLIAAASASAIAGEAGSIKRLAAFSNDWHRGVARRLSSVNALKRQALGEVTKIWPPLTKGQHKLAGGSLRWICDEDSLAMEGKEMRHCVGSYTHQCFAGTSHIASVVGSSGIRSTVEFRIKDTSIELGQHYTYRNKPPPKENAAVVTAFMDMARKRKSLIDFKALAKATERRLKARQRKKPKTAVRTVMSIEDAEALIRLYDDCLPKSLQGLTVEDWKRKLAEFSSLPPRQDAQREPQRPVTAALAFEEAA